MVEASSEPTASDAVDEPPARPAVVTPTLTPMPTPERLLIAPVLTGPDGEPRFVLVRWADWPTPALLSLAPPGPSDSLEDAVRDLLSARLQLTLTGTPRMAEVRVPVRMGSPRFGFTGTGWLRAVVAPVAGEPVPDALLAGADVLTLDEALAALSTEVERTLLRAAGGV